MAALPSINSIKYQEITDETPAEFIKTSMFGESVANAWLEKPLIDWLDCATENIVLPGWVEAPSCNTDFFVRGDRGADIVLGYNERENPLVERNFLLSDRQLLRVFLKLNLLSITQKIPQIHFESCPEVAPENIGHKKSPTFACKALIYLAPPDGLEPPT